MPPAVSIALVGCRITERRTLLLALRVNGEIKFKVELFQVSNSNIKHQISFIDYEGFLSDPPLLEGFPLLPIGGRLRRLLLLAAVHLAHIARDRLLAYIFGFNMRIFE